VADLSVRLNLSGHLVMSDQPRRLRRRWSEEFKRRVVAEASEPGVSAASVARRYDLNNNLVFNWKRRFGVDPAFLPVEVTAIPAPVSPTAVSPTVSVPPSEPEGSIEIALPNGIRVRVNGAFSADEVVRLVHGLSS